MSFDADEGPARQNGEPVVPLVPLDAGRKDVVQAESRRELHRFIDEAAAARADVNFLQRENIHLHRADLGGEHVDRR